MEMKNWIVGNSVRSNTFFVLQCLAKHSSTLDRKWNKCILGWVNTPFNFKYISSPFGKSTNLLLALNAFKQSGQDVFFAIFFWYVPSSVINYTIQNWSFIILMVIIYIWYSYLNQEISVFQCKFQLHSYLI